MNQQRVELLRRRIPWKTTKTRARAGAGASTGKIDNQKVESGMEEENQVEKEAEEKKDEDKGEDTKETKTEEGEDRRVLDTDADVIAPVNPFVVQLGPMEVKAWLVQVQR